MRRDLEGEPVSRERSRWEDWSEYSPDFAIRPVGAVDPDFSMRL